MVRVWCPRDARTPRSPTWPSPPVRRRSPWTNSSAATCEREKPMDDRTTVGLTRREAVQRVAAVLGGAALVGGDRLFAFSFEPAVVEQAMAHSTGAFTATDVALLDEVAETILPETSTPGAKAAKVGAFMAVMVTDTYEPGDQQIFRDGMKKVDDACRTMHHTAFMSATPPQRLAVLEQLDREQKTYTDAKADDAPAHYFRMMKELALFGYFTSEIGCTKAMRYVESPGRFDPCAPYTPGETIWASHA